MESVNETAWEQYSRRIAVINAAAELLKQERQRAEEDLTIADLQAAKKRIV
jgi:rhamnose utilization protein RhaD (predicted bifunctional aldolase and dehydrogenase)